MAAPMQNVASLALRGSQGVCMTDGPPSLGQKDGFQGSTSKGCRVMTFSADGSIFAYCDGSSVRVHDMATLRLLSQIDKPRTVCLVISPLNSVIATWEPYAVTKEQKEGTPNLSLWELQTGSLLRGFVQKKKDGWEPQWSADEIISARNVNNEVQFYENNNYAVIANKLHLQKVADFKIPIKAPAPYPVACYVPGSKGQPSYVRVFRYPHFGGPQNALANKSFYNAEKVDLLWNNMGTSVLVLTTVESSSTDSYYGDQGLHYISIGGESSLVPRGKNGPVYSVEWNPKGTEFCVVYGFMPAKATLYNLKCEAIFDFGTGPRNLAYYNPQGNILCLAGFGNLRGNMEFWDVQNRKMVSKPQATDTTFFEWCADGVHIVTATTSPRLRVGNGYKVWHHDGTVLYQTSMPAGEELWDVAWQPAPDGVFPAPRLTQTRVPEAAPQSQAKQTYVLPAMRGKEGQPVKATGPKYSHDYELPSNMKQKESTENPSKAALKNKKKREAKARAKAEETADTAESATGFTAAQGQDQSQTQGQGAASDPETDKKIRSVKKKLQQIAKLKDQQAAGKTLEQNQIEKLKSEELLMRELGELEVG